MLLYATTTSERASKGQGGKWIDVIIYDEDKHPALAIKVRHGGARRIHAFISTDMRYANASIENVGFIEEETKGNKKKDDKHVHDWDNYGKCTICGKWDTEGTRL